MPKSVETVFIALVVVGLLVYFYLEDQRLDAVLQEQQLQLELLHNELQVEVEQILADLEDGRLTHEESSRLMQQAAEQAQAKNLQTLERTLNEIVPEMADEQGL